MLSDSERVAPDLTDRQLDKATALARRTIDDLTHPATPARTQMLATMVLVLVPELRRLATLLQYQIDYGAEKRSELDRLRGTHA